jgi:hypothetical protein
LASFLENGVVVDAHLEDFRLQPNALKNALEISARRKAHGSISVQEGQASTSAFAKELAYGKKIPDCQGNLRRDDHPAICLRIVSPDGRGGGLSGGGIAKQSHRDDIIPVRRPPREEGSQTGLAHRTVPFHGLIPSELSEGIGVPGIGIDMVEATLAKRPMF